VVPIAFVSEHSETLVELDIEYGKLAKEHGVPHYARVPALGENAQFISSLASICKSNYPYEGTKPAEAPRRYCGSDWKKCPCIA
jgi:ferrochelatase